MVLLPLASPTSPNPFPSMLTCNFSNETTKSTSPLAWNVSQRTGTSLNLSLNALCPAASHWVPQLSACKLQMHGDHWQGELVLLPQRLPHESAATLLCCPTHGALQCHGGLQRKLTDRIFKNVLKYSHAFGCTKKDNCHENWALQFRWF